jgi:hypothetical protein
LCSSCRLTPGGYRYANYAASDVDAIAAYCGDLDTCYLIPIADVGGRSMLSLRLAPAANGQAVAIRWPATYEFSGAIAQLGERVAGSHEVGGSSPPGSTT